MELCRDVPERIKNMLIFRVDSHALKQNGRHLSWQEEIHLLAEVLPLFQQEEPCCSYDIIRNLERKCMRE